MESVVIAVAAVALLCVQAHRNWLMVQAAKRSNAATVINNVEAPVIPPISIQTAPPINEININLDYAKLSLAIAQAIQINQPVPHSGPYWQSPPISYPAINDVPPVTAEESSTNDIEINGYKAKKFPAR